MMDRDPDAGAPARRSPGIGARVVILVGTILIIVMLAVLPLLTPWFTHAALDASGAPGRLGLEPRQTHSLSDRSVEELVFGPGSFAMLGPDGSDFFDPDERDHLRDARTLLWLLFIIGGASLLLIGGLVARSDAVARRVIWRTMGRAGLFTAITIAALGALSVVAFGTVFTIFHQVFFPAGNFSFDPSTQRLVQLYPFRFWQIAAAALGILVFLLGIATWLLARRLARLPAERSMP